MSKLIMVRHGKSMWNHLNLFTGWVDVPLNQEGIEEALEAGKQIKNIPVDIVFVSSLIRAQMTAFLALSQHSGGKVPIMQHMGEGKLEEWGKIHSPTAEATSIPVIKAWQLNERMYGNLQGLNKSETIKKYGEEQVKVWRRSYDVAPPYGESLEMTAARSIPYFEREILPHLQAGKNVFIAAHGNSLRSIVMHLENLTKEQVLELELETGKPMLYSYQNDTFTKEDIGSFKG
ncbi:MAG: hypothetical protein K0S74_972 [Chlamydiales bacterium]|jgi:2,3-bisphosphoglycerate-dependent phosphoglycerate mutase|nr:hypothetical protein [Chlamydiales bacterium]